MDEVTSFICTHLALAIDAANYQYEKDGRPRTVIYSEALDVYMITSYGAPATEGDTLSIVYKTAGDNDDA